MIREEVRFEATTSSGEVSGLLVKPDKARCVLVLAHGAGAGMRHRTMEDYAHYLAELNIATFRYQFPFIEMGKRRPDHPAIAIKTVRSAVRCAGEIAGNLPLLAGGKSFGGRMTSTAHSIEPLSGVRGLVFYGFPLHAPGKASAQRGDHLFNIGIPMLFLQGTRDSLASLDYLRPLVDQLGSLATLEIFADGDHSLRVPKRAGKTDQEIGMEIAGRVKSWMESIPMQD